jgi:hypothetical protein
MRADFRPEWCPLDQEPRRSGVKTRLAKRGRLAYKPKPDQSLRGLGYGEIYRLRRRLAVVGLSRSVCSNIPLFNLGNHGIGIFKGFAHVLRKLFRPP